jgi:DNA-binding beta-propeller fold protein YncE
MAPKVPAPAHDEDERMRPIHRRFLTHLLCFWLIWLAAGPVAAQMRQIALPANDLVYDRVSRRLYASVPGRLGVLGNSVVAIDPETGRLGPYLFVGSEPGQLALSDDGQFLYVALDGAAAVARVDLREQRMDLQFPLGAGELGSFLVDDMAVLPGQPHSRHEGVAVYDDGVPRARITPRHTGSNAIEFGATAERLYGLNVESSQYGFQRMRVDGAGVTVLDVGMVPGIAGDFTFHDGLIYSGTGRVLEPETRRLVGTFSDLPSPALVLPDPASRRGFFLTRSGYAVEVMPSP